MNVKNKIKVGIIRGKFLNKFEMQNFEPLSQYFEIVTYASYRNLYNLKGIKLNTEKILTFEDIISNFPPIFKNILMRVLNRFLWSTYIIGISRKIKDKDIVHVAELFNRYTIQTIKLKKKFGYKIVVTVWDTIPFNFIKPYRKGVFSIKQIKKYLKDIDFFIAINEKAKISLQFYGVEDKKIMVLPMGVDIERFSPLSKVEKNNLKFTMGININKKIILFIGRLVWEKGIYDIVFAIKFLVDYLKFKDNFSVFIIGEGNEKQNVEKLIEVLELSDYIKILNHVSYEKIDEFYKISDIFILPSKPTYNWEEQLGMVLLEAMATGLPIITTSSGAIPEVVKDGGIIIPPGDFFSLSLNIKKLLEDEELRKKLGKRGREIAMEKFNRDKIAEKIAKIYNNVYKTK